MKRYLAPALILFISIGLFLGGNSLLARILDDRLPPLLTDVLGLPVTIDPLKADIVSLTASTPRLVMGGDTNPAVIAENVTVSLNWSDLLRGEIRLIDGSISDLTLQLSNWPTSGDPWPQDYMFLDQWIPSSVSLVKGRYLDKGGEPYPVHEALWERNSEGASVRWRESRFGGEVQLSATLDTLFGLLKLEPIGLDLTLSKPGETDSEVDFRSKFSPAKNGGYDVSVDINAAGATGRIQAGNDTAWQPPAFSRTVVDKLELDQISTLVNTYRERSGDPDGQSRLHVPLPALALPEHRGTVSIGEIRLKDEVGKDTTFVLNTGPSGLEVTELVSSGARGMLDGEFSLATDSSGWKVSLEATMKARDAGKTLAPEYLESEWIWQEGQTSLIGQGSSWQALLGSMGGNIELSGYHSGEVDTPVAITALLDKKTEDFRLHDLDIRLGTGSITGEVTLSAQKRPLLNTLLKGKDLELDFLFEEQSPAAEPGVTIPEYLGFFPTIDIDGEIAIDQLSAPGLKLSSANIKLKRSPDGGSLLVDARGVNSGSVALKLLVASVDGNSRDVTLTVDLSEVDLAELFQQEMNLFSRSTGKIDFTGTGDGLTSIFNSLQGQAKLSNEFRRDDNWQRGGKDEETVEVAGDATLVIDGPRVVGIQLDNINMDSIDQDVTGSLTMRADQVPWLTADFAAEKLDIDGLLALLPETAEEADRTDLLSLLQQLGAASMSLSAETLLLSEQSLSSLTLEVDSAPDKFAVKQLDFMYEGSPLKSSGGLTWSGQTAKLSAKASIREFNLDRFLVPGGSSEAVPVSGDIDLQSEGENFSALLSNVTGRVSLASDLQGPDVKQTQRRRVEIKAQRAKGGMQAEVAAFEWGLNSLQGSFFYKPGDRPMFDVTLDGGSIDLEPWEKTLDNAESKTSEKEGSLLATTARTSAKLVTDILRSPARLFSGPSEAKPGEKLFDNDPLPYDALQGYDATFKGKVNSVSSRAGVFKGLDVDGSIQSGKLQLDAAVDTLNGGPADILLALDTRLTPASIELSGNFKNIGAADDTPKFTRSGFFSISSKGDTSAQVAANVNGQVYVELGKGPFDFTNFSMFTSDVATEIVRTLLPGAEKRKPELECGVVLGVFDSGKGTTPVGYTVRTDKANIIGRMNIDLHKEEVEIALDSRSREGVGLSVGNVFSNTIRVKGPLTNPQVVPNTTGILWRGWAAFMTAGLSVLGESVLKRAMAAENPCISIKNDIRKVACGTDQPLAKSQLVCGS